MSDLIIIRGGGDLATGVIQKFYRCKYKILVLEVSKPLAIRRNVSLCQCVYDKTAKVEDVFSKLIYDLSQIEYCYKNNIVPFYIDPTGDVIKKLNPICVVDAIIAKKNLGTNKSMAKITIALGPGFYASKDVDIVIETKRGHDLGKLIFDGEAKKNTGIPGNIEGKSHERVIHACKEGTIRHVKNIGDIVRQGETIFFIDDTEVKAKFDGVLRGLIQEGLYVNKNLKIADIDPRLDTNYNTISDKARALGGAVLEAFIIKKAGLL